MCIEWRRTLTSRLYRDWRLNRFRAWLSQGKVALITGGDSGIGRAVGHHFALEGATVLFTYLPAVESKDADDTIDILKKAQTTNAKDPFKIGVDLGFDENCQNVKTISTPQSLHLVVTMPLLDYGNASH